jgi:acyl carrier protein
MTGWFQKHVAQDNLVYKKTEYYKSISKKVIDIIMQTLGFPVAQIGPTTNLAKKLQVDSRKNDALTLAIEMVFGINLPKELYLKTVDEITDIVYKEVLLKHPL